MDNDSLTSIFILDFLGKNPQNMKDFKEKKQGLNVVAGFFRKTLENAVYSGVIRALNDAFGK